MTRIGPLLVIVSLCIVMAGCARVSVDHLYSQAPTPNPKTHPNPQHLPQAEVLTTFKIPDNNDVVGRLAQTTVKQGDTLAKIAQRYDIGYQDLMRANPGVDPKHLQVGQKLIIPTMYILPPPDKREGIVINIPELRLYDFTQAGQVSIYPVALGRQGWRTPVSETYIYKKKEKPTWHVPQSIREHYQEKYGKELSRVVPPGPDNPLGKYAVYLHKSGYLIHGTNRPGTIGHFVSSGCIRMYPDNIKQVFEHAQQGIPVHIIYSTYKAGWLDNALYLSAYKPVEHEKDLYQVHHRSLNEVLKGAKQRRDQSVMVNHHKIQAVVSSGRGVPTRVGYTGITSKS